MAKPTHYSPHIRRGLVRVLYYERLKRGIPMTTLVDAILTDALKSTESWRMREEPAPGEGTNESFA
jgi:hypothetical protein